MNILLKFLHLCIICIFISGCANINIGQIERTLRGDEITALGDSSKNVYFSKAKNGEYRLILNNGKWISLQKTMKTSSKEINIKETYSHNSVDYVILQDDNITKPKTFLIVIPEDSTKIAGYNLLDINNFLFAVEDEKVHIFQESNKNVHVWITDVQQSVEVSVKTLTKPEPPQKTSPPRKSKPTPSKVPSTSKTSVPQVKHQPANTRRPTTKASHSTIKPIILPPDISYDSTDFELETKVNNIEEGNTEKFELIIY